MTLFSTWYQLGQILHAYCARPFLHIVFSGALYFQEETVKGCFFLVIYRKINKIYISIFFVLQSVRENSLRLLSPKNEQEVSASVQM